MYGAEKLQWYEGEVEVDAERAGCFAERLIRLGLVVDGVTSEYGAWGGTPVERTKGSPPVRFGADKEDGAFPLACKVHILGSGAMACSAAPEVQALFTAQTNRTEISRRRKDETQGNLTANVFEYTVLSVCNAQLCTSEWSVS